MYDALRGWLFKLDPEAAHGLTLYGLGVAQRSGLMRCVAHAPPGDFSVRAFGIDFPNPVGLAAGLDKNGEHLDALGALGFGFVDIGKNADTPNERAADDYLFCLERVYPLASYVTVNISSPNTKGLRELQGEDALPRLLGALREKQEQLTTQHRVRKPLLLKIAPDLDEAQMDAIARAVLDAGIDGLICTNTTLDRTAVADDPQSAEPGGLSGKPLFERATAILRGMSQRLDGKIPLIGVGGI